MALVGLVVVSHSRRLAESAVELALQMVHGEQPPIAIAAGMPDGGLGTDAMEVMSAIQDASVGAGVVVLVDLGSAVMSAEMAVEFLDEEAADVRIVAAPFVEGLLAAAVTAAGGASLDAVAREATGALSPKLIALGADDEPADQPPARDGAWEAEATGSATLPNADGLHARPAAMLAAEAARFDAEVRVAHVRGTVGATSPIGLATLSARHGEELRIEARGVDAQRAVDALVQLVSDGFGEAGPDPDAPLAPVPETPRTGTPLGVSPGRVVGPVARMVQAQAPSERSVDADGVDAERELLHQALDVVAHGYEDLATGADPAAADILRATAALTRDPALRTAADELIATRRISAANALWQAAADVAATFAAGGGLLAERVTDVLDIRDRVVAHLLGVAVPGIPAPGHPFVLVARDLAPAETTGLDPEVCLGIVVAEGGPTSHTSILARSMGIPAVVGHPDAMSLVDGTVVLVDGGTGEVVVDPSEEQRAGARTGPEPLVPLTAPGATADGVPVPLLANIGSARDARGAAEAGAEGVGLFRTELPFLGRGEEPSVEEQVELYTAVLAPFDGKRVVVRTLDAGSDKPVPFLGIGDEPNPALGIRGYRTAARHPDILERQLRAVAQAARATGADVWVMAPMISTPDEAADFAALAREAGIGSVGVMVETPSAALQAAEVLRHVDFVSVGTNDLTQYAMAADREATGLGALQDAWQPGVLRLLDMIGAAARAAGKPAGVCGEAASDPLLAPVLVGMGFTSLSMGARQLHPVARALGSVPASQCPDIARAACAADSSGTARRAVQDLLGGGRAA